MKHDSRDFPASAIVAGNGPRQSIAEYLGKRPIKDADLKQRIRYFARWQPKIVQKWIQKAVWNSRCRQMHYVPPGIMLEPSIGGRWVLRHRNRQVPEWMSSPLGELTGARTRPATLVATGPSALNFDWSSLEGGQRQIWAVNGASSLLADRDLRCDYLIVTDHRFAKDGAEYIELAVRLGARLLFSYEAAAGFAATRPEVLRSVKFHVFEKVDSWYGLPRLGGQKLAALNGSSGGPFVLDPSLRHGVGWSHDPVYGVFPGRTVAFAALQLMVWSGARDIEVVGLDLGGKGRAYQEDVPTVSHLERDKAGYILPAFACMARALAGTGIRIANLSQVSPLPAQLVPDDQLP